MKLSDKQKYILETLGYQKPEEILNHFPYRYENLEVKDPNTWQTGDNVVFHGFLESSFVSQRLGGKRSITRFKVSDSLHHFNVVIFNRAYLKESHYQNGITVIGTLDKNGSINAKTINSKSLKENLGIKPTYPLRQSIKNYEIVKLVGKVLSEVDIQDEIPQEFIQAYRLMSRKQALRTLHQPQKIEHISFAARTLKYEEFLKYHLKLALDSFETELGSVHYKNTQQLDTTISNLPYTLTPDQLSSLQCIIDDLEKAKRMQRLLQGDVGSGKTIVSFLSMLGVIEAGYQVAFMVPTEILLQQHLTSFKKMFPNIPVASLSQSSEDKAVVLDEIASGRARVVFGTHALFSKTTTFHNLGYVIIDEQHRFGVEQRRKLIDKGENVDVLMLSATPIPRTLANALYFNLEVSTISTYPKSRKPLLTKLIRENSLRTIQSHLETKLKEGEQVYVVCPAIEEDEREGIRNVLDIYKNLCHQFEDYKVGMLHGKMKADDKNDIMNQFNNHEIDLIVTTTVIEVGVDVHNANTMVIYNSELFGLATLHQLRGRVGRGVVQGECYLLTHSNDSDALKRLEAMENLNDGFELSMIDMRNRGVGDALGTRQSGLPSFLLGDIEKDLNILNQAKKDAIKIINDRHNADYKAIFNSLTSQDYNKII